MASKRSQIDDLARLMAAIRGRGQAKKLLTDLLTPQEVEELAMRWKIAQELLRDRPQREIAAQLSVSISKITRVSQAVQYGSGGLALFAKRLKTRKRKGRRRRG